jgi:alpha-galactosidase
MKTITQVVEQIVLGELVPVAFRLAGQPVLLSLHRHRSLADGSQLLTYHVAAQPLQLSLTLVHDAPRNWLRLQANLAVTGQLSGRISELRIFSLLLPHADDPVTTLRVFGGGSARSYTHDHFPPTTFLVHDQRLRGHDVVQLEEDTGRGSNDHLPLFVYGDTESGLWCGPEWQGSWRFRLQRMPGHSHLSLCLHNLDAQLYQGEEIPLPAVAIGSYQGDLGAGCNQMRRVMRECYLPDLNGIEPTPPVSYQVLAGERQVLALDDQLLNEVDRAAEIGCQYFTLCSLWQYRRSQPGEHLMWWNVMGRMQPDADRFGDRFQDLVDRIRGHGMRLGLWIDPRVAADSPWAEREADVLLHASPAQAAAVASGYDPIGHDINQAPLLDLSRAAGRAVLLQWLETMVALGAERIWYDLNTDPRLYHFVPNETENRRGLLELRYFQGMDQVMAEFRRRHPGIWFEMCASGGRMLNLAVLRHSHSFWITDYTGADPDIAAGIRAGVNLALPAVCNHQSIYLRKELAGDEVPDLHELACHCNGHLGVGPDLWRQSAAVLAAMQQVIAVYRAQAELLRGDYHRLSPVPSGREQLDAWQYHDPQTGAGLIGVQALSEHALVEELLCPLGVAAGTDLQAVLGDAAVSWQDGQLRIAWAEQRLVLLRYG